MKRLLLIALLSCLTVVSVRATQIWQETWAYGNGSVETNSGGNWVKDSGSANPPDMDEWNGYLELAGTSASPVNRQDDCYRYYGNTYSNQIVTYASFIIICTNRPNGPGEYFASFYSTNAGYYGRIFGMSNSAALPNTWRLGVNNHGVTPTNAYPVDLATNVPYLVVAKWDPLVNDDIQLWVNPVSESDYYVNASDSFTQPALPVNAFSFRQASGAGNAFFQIGTLTVGTTFADVSSPPTLAAPTIVMQPVNTTNGVGTTMSLSVLANGQSLSAVTYQWQKADSSNPGTYTNIPVAVNSTANANVFTIYPAELTDSAQYQVVVANPNNTSLTATSNPAWIFVNNTPGAPTICGSPAASTSVPYGGNATLSVCANGTPPISYTWFYNGTQIGPTANYSFSPDGSALTVTDVEAANNTVGNYTCTVSGYWYTQSPLSQYETNIGPFAVAGIPPTVTNIDYLRGLVDGTKFLPTNTTTIFQVTGTVISKTNYTTTVNGEFFIQDNTGGIEVYWYGAGGAVPQLGDNVTVTGPLGEYEGMMEIEPNVGNPGTGVITNSHNNPLPASKVLPCSFTNSAAYGGISNALRYCSARLVTFTNVNFPDADGTKTFNYNYSDEYSMVDEAGNAIILYVYYGTMEQLLAMVIPTGTVWRVTGVMALHMDDSATDRSSGYQFQPSMPEDFQLTPATTAIEVTGTTPTLTWQSILPLTLYSVWSANNVTGPYSLLVQTDFTYAAFNITNQGSYTDLSAPAASKFYKITCP